MNNIKTKPITENVGLLYAINGNKSIIIGLQDQATEQIIEISNLLLFIKNLSLVYWEIDNENTKQALRSKNNVFTQEYPQK